MLTAIDTVVPIAVFLFSFVTLLLLARFVLERLDNWGKIQTWPAGILIRDLIRKPLIVFILVISAFLGVLSSNSSWSWRGDVVASLWSIFVLFVALSLLKTVQDILELIGQTWALRNSVLAIRVIFTIITVTAAALIILEIWGVQTSPFLFVIAAISILAAIGLRDLGPDYAAGFLLAVSGHIKVGESIKVQDGEEGILNKMGWHNVEILTLDGRSIIIPNSRFQKMKIIKIPKKNEEAEILLGTTTQPSANINEMSEPPIDISTILSRRELEIAMLISQGASNKELANKLGIAENTVKVHMKNILQKLNLSNRQQLAVLAASQPKRVN